MKCFMHLFNVFPVNVCIDLCGGNERMSEKLLNNSQIGSSLEKVCRKRVAEGVRTCVLFYTRKKYVFVKDLPESHSAERRAAGIEEQEIF